MTALSTSLTDRYVTATVRHVAGKHREEIERELRSSIADDVEARVELGETPEHAEYAALTELGDPDHLAARYADRSTSLIGPRTYLIYKRVLVLACVTVLPIVYLVNGLGHWVRHDNVGASIFAPLGVTLNVTMYLLVAVTLVYLLVDRVGTEHADKDAERWKPEHLPLTGAVRSTTWEEVSAGAVLAALLVIGFFVQRGVKVTSTSGARVPILDPGLWNFWIYYFIALMVLGIALVVANLRAVEWTPRNAVLGTVLILAATVPLAILFFESAVLNRSLGSSVFTEHGTWISWLAIVVLALVTVAVLAKTWRHRKGN